MSGFRRDLAHAERRARAGQAPFAFRGPLGGGMFGGTGPLAPLRFIASRGSVPTASAGGLASMMSRWGTFARDAITPASSMRLAWANWIADGTMSGVVGNVMSIAASVEYPAGTFTQVKFGGSATGTTGPLTTLQSDPVSVTIPNGAQFWVRTWQTGTVGILFSSINADTTIGEASEYPGSNLTMGGSVPAAAAQICGPTHITGRTNKKTWMLVGDSRQVGIGDSGQSAIGTFGEMLNGLNAFAGCNVAQAGQTVANYLSHAGALQLAIQQYATDVVCALGINDLLSITAAQLITAQATLRALYASANYHVTTLDPDTTSTDNWATLVNQTVTALEGQRVIYNTNVRATSLGYSPAYDCAAVSESSLNSGKWKVDGTANKYTVDGLHQSTFCYGLYGAAGFTL